jgi:hypothetical protein
LNNFKVLSVSQNRDEVSVAWEDDFGNTVEMYNIIFDNDSSCTNLSTRPPSKTITTTIIEAGSYEVYAKALVSGKWLVSEPTLIQIN